MGLRCELGLGRRVLRLWRQGLPARLVEREDVRVLIELSTQCCLRKLDA